MITTKSTYISYNQATFEVPAYSKLLNIFYDDNQFTILYEFEPEQTENKSFVIQYWESTVGTTEEYFIPYDFKYWGSITNTKPILSSVSSGMGIHTNISLDLINVTRHFHIFVQEILTISEIRDRKIEGII